MCVGGRHAVIKSHALHPPCPAPPHCAVTLETTSNFQNIKDLLMGFVNSVVLVLHHRLQPQREQIWSTILNVSAARGGGGDGAAALLHVCGRVLGGRGRAGGMVLLRGQPTPGACDNAACFEEVHSSPMEARWC